MAAAEAGGVASTALWTAYCRAEESRRAAPLIVDPLAALLCGEEGMQVGRALEDHGQAHDAIVVRTRILDDRVREACDRGLRAIFSIGSGLCARPYRLDLPRDVRFVEVDLPFVVAWKEQRLAEAGIRRSPPVVRVPVDLVRIETLEPALAELADDQPLLIVMEGVIQYLPLTAVRALFARFSARAGETRVACDIGGGAWSRFFARRISTTAARGGAPYLTRIGDPQRFFQPLGFETVSSISLAEWDAGQPSPRWRTPWTARLLPGFRDAARVVELLARTRGRVNGEPTA